MTFASRVFQALFALFAATLIISGCASLDVAAQAAPQAATPTYKLGTGDRVRVTVFGEQSLNGEYPVGSDGTIALPLIGNVEARGLTITELQQVVVKKLTPAYILDPRVSVDVTNFRPFYILGEVARPGSYPYVDGLSVAQAVAIAGGHSYRANKKKVFIRHADQATEVMYSLKGSSQVWVQPGDTVRIVERFF